MFDKKNYSYVLYFLLALIFCTNEIKAQKIFCYYKIGDTTITELKLYVDSSTNLIRAKIEYVTVPAIRDFIMTPKYVENNNKVIPMYNKEFTGKNGYITYEYYYNSRIDTPYNSTAFQQHTVSGQIHLKLNDRYPLNLSFSTRQTNNSYFRNLFDMGLNFDRYAFAQMQRDKYLKEMQLDNPVEKMIARNQDSIKKCDSLYNSYSTKLDSRSIIQKIVHEREQQLFTKNNSTLSLPKINDSIVNTPLSKSSITPQKANTLDSTKGASQHLPADSQFAKGVIDKLIKKGLLLKGKLSTDSTVNTKDSAHKTQTEVWYMKQLAKLDSLKQSKSRLENKNDSLMKVMFGQHQVANTSFGEYDNFNSHKGQLNGNYNKKGGDKIMGVLQNVKSVGIGRTNVDYTELTAKNLNITGLQIEYQPDYYYAIAAGKVNYSFRDFLLPNNPIPQQDFYIARFGMIKKNRSSLIFSLFTGKKSSYISDNLVSNHFSGYSVDGKISLDSKSFVELEVAKTTPAPSLISVGKKAHLLGVDNNSNMGLIAKAHYVFSKTNTTIDGEYRKLGYSFQSINLFSNNLIQNSWSAKVEQQILKKVLKFTFVIKTNDFSYPSTIQSYNTNSIFKSFKLDYRKKAFFTSIGYYPSTQLVTLDSGKIAQNIYYMFNTTSGYTKKIGRFYSSTVMNYNIFINKSTDTGFVYYNAKSLQLNETLNTQTICLQTGLILNYQPLIKFHTIESTIDISKIRWFSFSVGIKYNKVTDGSDYWGGNAGVKINIARNWALLKINYDQVFIPNVVSNLLSKSDVGRITLTKNL